MRTVIIEKNYEVKRDTVTYHRHDTVTYHRHNECTWVAVEDCCRQERDKHHDSVYLVSHSDLMRLVADIDADSGYDKDYCTNVQGVVVWIEQD